jgi:hypothetical protein
MNLPSLTLLSPAKMMNLNVWEVGSLVEFEKELLILFQLEDFHTSSSGICTKILFLFVTSMSCFWDGLRTGLQVAGCINKSCTNSQLVQVLKANNVPATQVTWNGQPLRSQELSEAMEAVKVYDAKTIDSGYLCSTCDPFLLLICQLFRVNINHQYCSTNIEYTIKNSKKTIYFRSDKGHFRFLKTA